MKINVSRHVSNTSALHTSATLFRWSLGPFLIWRLKFRVFKKMSRKFSDEIFVSSKIKTDPGDILAFFRISVSKMPREKLENACVIDILLTVYDPFDRFYCHYSLQGVTRVSCLSNSSTILNIHEVRNNIATYWGDFNYQRTDSLNL